MNLMRAVAGASRVTRSIARLTVSFFFLGLAPLFTVVRTRNVPAWTSAFGLPCTTLIASSLPAETATWPSQAVPWLSFSPSVTSSPARSAGMLTGALAATPAGVSPACASPVSVGRSSC